MNVKKQSKFIFNELENMSICDILCYDETVKKISIPLIQEILKNRFYNGPDMKAVLCLFNTVLKSYNIDFCKGMYKLNTSIDQWDTNIRKSKSQGSQAIVYFTNIISDVETVIKIPKNDKQFEQLIKEYFIGIAVINNLRYKVPNFMYTLGGFIQPYNPKKCNTFISCEKIPGITLEKALKQNKIDFNDYLNIYVQLLLALEVAQQDCRFCHYDLHVNNIVLRPINKPYSYTLVFNDKRYDITAKKYIPVIIDFGIATVRYKKQTIGSQEYSKYGMKQFLIQGVDMYKILFYSYVCSSGNLQRQIGNLFLFYGQYDPYKVLVSTQNELATYTKEYIKKISTSIAGTYTPYEFVNWIINNPDMAVSSVKIRDRDIYIPIMYESYSEKYDTFFKHCDQDYKTNIVNSESESLDSYIFLTYMYKILQQYPKKHFEQKIKQIEQKLKTDKTRLIQTDYNNIKYKNIQCPEEFELYDSINQIVVISLDEKIKTEKIKLFLDLYNFFIKLKPCFQYLYTIKELKLEDDFENFIKEFTSSPQYKLYIKLYPSIERAYRWNFTLYESLF